MNLSKEDTVLLIEVLDDALEGFIDSDSETGDHAYNLLQRLRNHRDNFNEN
jgi:hypothetical protein